jgi:hypothetical protein
MEIPSGAVNRGRFEFLSKPWSPQAPRRAPRRAPKVLPAPSDERLKAKATLTGTQGCSIMLPKDFAARVPLNPTRVNPEEAPDGRFPTKLESFCAGSGPARGAASCIRREAPLRTLEYLVWPPGNRRSGRSGPRRWRLAPPRPVGWVRSRTIWAPILFEEEDLGLLGLGDSWKFSDRERPFLISCPRIPLHTWAGVKEDSWTRYRTIGDRSETL